MWQVKRVSWGGVWTWETWERGNEASRRDIKARSSGEAPRQGLKMPEPPHVTAVKNPFRMHWMQGTRAILLDRSGHGVSVSDVR